jgi:hypothetical protein
VHARFHAVYSHDVVQAVGQAEICPIYLLFTQELLIVGIDGRADTAALLKLAGNALGRFIVDVTYSGDDKVIQASALEICHGENVTSRNAARTDQG